MDKLLEHIALETPGLFVAIAIVWIFIKYLSKKDEAIAQLFVENKNAREHSAAVIERNSQALGENTEALRENSEVIKTFAANSTVVITKKDQRTR